MTKKDLVSRISAETGCTKKITNEIVNSFVRTISSLEDGDRLTLTGFGTFEFITTKPRLGRNPKTGETVDIPKRRILIFKSSRRRR